jgi:multiple sugar transport system substrate-binding protein
VSTTGDGRRSLRALTWEHERGQGSLTAAASRYRELTGVHVEVRARSLQAFADEPLDRATAGFDLVVLDHPHIPLAAEAGWLVPLDGTGHDQELSDLAAHSVGRSHASYRHGGRQWGLAHDAAAQVAAYRPDLLPAPPRTWAEVLDLAREGRVLWPAKPIDAFSSLCTLAAHTAALNPARHTDDAAPGLADGSAEHLTPTLLGECLELLHQLAALVPAECLTHNPIDVAERLVGDEGFAYAPLLFGYTNYSRLGYRRHRLRYVDMPVLTAGAAPIGSLLGGAGVAVPSTSEHIAQAVDFAFWVAGSEAQCGIYFDGGGQPAHAVAWQDDRLNRETLDFFRGTRSTLEGAWTRPRAVGFLPFQDSISELVTACLRGEVADRDLIATIGVAADRWLTPAAGDHDRSRLGVAGAHR